MPSGIFSRKSTHNDGTTAYCAAFAACPPGNPSLPAHVPVSTRTPWDSRAVAMSDAVM
jgi:hypothetical protein